MKLLEQIGKSLGERNGSQIQPIDLGGWVYVLSSLRDPPEINSVNSCETMSSPLLTTATRCVPDLIDRRSLCENGDTESSDLSSSEDDSAPFLVSSSESSDCESSEAKSSDGESPEQLTSGDGDDQYQKKDVRGHGVDTKVGDEGSGVSGTDSLFRETAETVQKFFEDGGNENFEN